MVFVISRIIKVEVCINRSQRLRLIALTETLIILDITKTESNNCFIIYWTKQKKKNSCSCFFTDGKQNKASELDLDMIILRNHAPRSLPVTLYNLQLWRHRRWFRNFTVRLRPTRKEIASSMYNNNCNLLQITIWFQLFLVLGLNFTL